MRRVVIACLLLVPSVARADLMLRLLGDGDGAGAVTGAPPANPDDLIAWAGTPKQIALPDLLQQAIRMAPTLQNAKIDIAVAEAQIAETWERHDWLLKAQATGSKSGTTLFAGIAINSSSSFVIGGDISRILPTGGTIDLHVGTQYSNTQSTLFSSKYWQDAVTASITQPLLKGRGSALYDAAENKADLGRDAVVLARRLAALTTVQAVIATYWDLVLAERQVAITEQSLALARERLRVTEVQVKGGKVADAEIPAVQQIIATREEDVLNGELGVLNASIGLRRTVGLPIGAGELGLRVATDLDTRDVPYDLGALVERAYAASPELAQLAKQDAASTIDIEVTENGLLPQLDLALSFGPTGTDTKFVDTAKDLAEFKAYQVNGSLTFSRSLHQYDVRYRSTELRTVREKLRVNAFDLRAQIASAMSRAVAAIELAKRRVVLSQRAIDLANQNIRIETDRFNLGRSTNFDVLNRLEEARQAELRKAQALIDWHKAETTVLTLTGDLLPMFGITVE
jgi:outer membrane protein TolC